MGGVAVALLALLASSAWAAGCGSCKPLDDVRAQSLEMIKAQILRKIGMKQAPNITGRVLPPVPLRELEIVEMQADEPEPRAGLSVDEDDDDDRATTEKMFLFSQKHPRLRHRHEHHILYFPLAETAAKYRVSNATLFVYVEGGDRRPLPDVAIEVFKVLRPPGAAHGGADAARRQVAYAKVRQPYGRGAWVPLELAETTGEWFKNPRENHGFVVTADLDGKSMVVTDPDGPDKGKVPYLEITPEAPKRRTRRSIGLNCDENTAQPLCCRYPLTVKFEEIGWDFILAPKSYEAFYCRGECPYLTLQKHAHTHLVAMASSNTVHPCCTPRKMRNITMIYYDVNLNVIMANLPGMVVDRCGCS